MKTQPIYDYVIDQLNLTKGQWPDVSEKSGVPKRTIEKIARKEIENPGIQHIQTLADYFHSQGSQPTGRHLADHSHKAAA